MKTHPHRLHRLSAIILSVALVLTSCTKVETPEPSENPVLLTYEAQTKLITVIHLQIIGENCDTDVFFEEGENIIVESEWVRFTQLGYVGGDAQAVRINVKENTTSQPRTHTVRLKSKIEDTILTVTQTGKP